MVFLEFCLIGFFIVPFYVGLGLFLDDKWGKKEGNDSSADESNLLLLLLRPSFRLKRLLPDIWSTDHFPFELTPNYSYCENTKPWKVIETIGVIMFYPVAQLLWPPLLALLHIICWFGEIGNKQKPRKEKQKMTITSKELGNDIRANCQIEEHDKTTSNVAAKDLKNTTPPPRDRDDNDPTENKWEVVKGWIWLTFFIFYLKFLIPLGVLLSYLNYYGWKADLFSIFPQARPFMWIWLGFGAFLGFLSFLAGSDLLNIGPHAVKDAKGFLLIYLVYKIVSALLFFFTTFFLLYFFVDQTGLTIDKTVKDYTVVCQFGLFIGRIFYAVIFFTIWSWYLKNSKGVKAIYGKKNLQRTQ